MYTKTLKDTSKFVDIDKKKYRTDATALYNSTY